MYSSEFHFSNYKETDLLLIIEPSGEEYIIKPQEKWSISCKIPEADLIEVEHHNEYIIIYTSDYSITEIKNIILE